MQTLIYIVFTIVSFLILSSMMKKPAETPFSVEEQIKEVQLNDRIWLG